MQSKTKDPNIQIGDLYKRAYKLKRRISKNIIINLAATIAISAVYFLGAPSTIVTIFICIITPILLIFIIIYIIFYIEANNIIRNIKMITTPPGSKIISVIKFIYSRKTIERIFTPILSDWLEEYFKALHEKAHWKARWINMRYRLTFLGTMLAHAVSTVGRKVRNIWQLTGGG